MDVVARLGLAGLDLAAADALEGGERSARLLDDPDVHLGAVIGLATSGGLQVPSALVMPRTFQLSGSLVKHRLLWMCHWVSGPPMSGTVVERVLRGERVHRRLQLAVPVPVTR